MNYFKKHIFLVFTVVVLGIFLVSESQTRASDTGVVSATVSLAVCGDGVKDYGEQCDRADLHGKSCTTLGYDSGTLACSASCQFDTTSCVTDASAFSNVTLSPTADRTYILPNGSDAFGIFLPAQFNGSDLTLYLFSHDTTPRSPTGQSLVGKISNLLFVNENGDIVDTLGKSSTITLSYADMDLGTTDESTLAPYRSEDGGLTWTVIPSFSLDRNAKTITFSSNTFSIFSIFGLPLTTQTNAIINGGVGNGGGAVGGGIWTPPKATEAEKKNILKAADFNSDGIVDLSDLSILLYFEQSESTNSRYDLNKDGIIDLTDISIMLYYWEVTT